MHAGEDRPEGLDLWAVNKRFEVVPSLVFGPREE